MFKFSFSVKKILFNYLFIIAFVTIILFGAYTRDVYNVKSVEQVNSNENDLHEYLVHHYLEKRESWNTSNLGSLLFKFHKRHSIGDVEDKKFVILTWKHWDWLKNRHVNRFGNKREEDPLDGCSVKNCILTGDDKYLDSADAVVVHVQKGIFPQVSNRNTKQRWIFLNDEAPSNAFSRATITPQLEDLANVFNWSMTYRMDADVPVPYGRTVPLPKQLIHVASIKSLAALVPYWSKKRHDKLASVLMSNCGVSRRMEYLSDLEKYLPLDIYGKCSKDHKDSCPGHFRADCNVTSQYLFYLVLENSHCREYLTEKGFHFAYSKGAIPIIMGPRVEECETILPPGSFLHVDNFDKPKDLADYIIQISKNDEDLLKFHKWRNHFEIVNEHGYFGTKSFHYCRVCEALNYNDKREKIYDEQDLREFLDPAELCF